MKVLMTADAVGGVWTYVRELIAGFGDQAEVVLAVMGPAPTPAQREELDRLPLTAFEHRPYALEWMGDPWEDGERAAEWLLELHRSHRPDVVHLNGFAHAALPFDAPVVVVGHSCVLSWHEAVRRFPAGEEWPAYRERVTRGLAGAAVLVAPTAAMLGALERLYEPECELVTIPNGLEAKGLAPRDKRPFVLGVGRAWDEAKNLVALERVARQLPWPVLVAGEGGSLGRVEGEALRTLFGHAAVFAEPARYEPFGLAALEAARAGCALILGDIPSLREVWADSAVYVDPFDDASLVRAIGRLAADPARTARLGGAAAARSSLYTRARMAASYLDLYRTLAPIHAVEAAA